MKDIFTDPVFISAALAWILQMVLTPLVKRIPPTNIAWVFIRALHGMFDKIDPPSALPIIGVLLGLGASMMCQGCSLEAARTRRINSQLHAEARSGYTAPARTKASDEFCKATDNWKLGIDIGAGAVIAPIGVGAGIVAAADTSQKIENIAVATVLVAAAAEAVAVGASSKLASVYEEKCQ
jgi:hypothetical protein